MAYGYEGHLWELFTKLMRLWCQMGAGDVAGTHMAVRLRESRAESIPFPRPFCFIIWVVAHVMSIYSHLGAEI